MISAIRKRTLSNNSTIDFEQLSEIEMPEILCKPEKAIVSQPTRSRLGELHFVKADGPTLYISKGPQTIKLT